MQVPTLACEYLIEDLKSKQEPISGKNAFWIVSLHSMDCSLDCEHILRVSSKYLP